MKKSELSALVNECIREVIAEDKIKIDEGFKEKFKQFMGTGWDKAKAEQAYNQTYAKQIKDIATKLNSTPEEVKAALIKFMEDNGGLAILGGNGKNAIWQPDSKSFKRQAGLAPSSGANVSETKNK